MTSCNKPDFYNRLSATCILILKLQQGGKIDNLQQIGGIFDCMYCRSNDLLL